jgi:putative phosphoribosyl transferase
MEGSVEIAAGSVLLPGQLVIPRDARGVVVFAHGSGSSRHSPRNQSVATELNQRGLGTLLFDLLVPEEEHDRANVFDIDLLGERLLAVTHWLAAQRDMEDRRIGYFGASTGAAAALWAAAETDVAAVVSRGGRPDLAGGRLSAVTAPTLLIVGSRDHDILELNRQAQRLLRCNNELAIVPGATHLFEEPGTLEQVASLAGGWFGGYLGGDA